jgi:hypothetical protein
VQVLERRVTELTAENVAMAERLKSHEEMKILHEKETEVLKGDLEKLRKSRQDEVRIFSNPPPTD